MLRTIHTDYISNYPNSNRCRCHKYSLWIYHRHHDEFIADILQSIFFQLISMFIGNEESNAIHKEIFENSLCELQYRTDQSYGVMHNSIMESSAMCAVEMVFFSYPPIFWTLNRAPWQMICSIWEYIWYNYLKYWNKKFEPQIAKLYCHLHCQQLSEIWIELERRKLCEKAHGRNCLSSILKHKSFIKTLCIMELWHAFHSLVFIFFCSTFAFLFSIKARLTFFFISLLPLLLLLFFPLSLFNIHIMWKP